MMAAASEPASGSVRLNAKYFSPWMVAENEIFFLSVRSAGEKGVHAVADVSEDHGGEIQVVHPSGFEDEGQIERVASHAAVFLGRGHAYPPVIRQGFVRLDGGFALLVAIHRVFRGTDPF